MTVHTIPGKLTVRWEASAGAIVDTWVDYDVTLAEFKEAVLGKGLVHAKANKGQAWIVDSSGAAGNFTKECQEFIASDVFPAFAAAGIKYFLTIKSKSALTNMTIKTYQSKTGPNGLQLVEADSVDGAVAWLMKNAP